MLENIPLPMDKAQALIRHCEEEGIGYVLSVEDSDLVVMKDFRFLEQAGRRTELTTYRYEPDLDVTALPAIYKIYIAIPKEAESRYPWISLHGHLRMGTYLNYQYDAKTNGIIRMMKLLDAPLEDVVVFGDAVNDLVMFDPMWTSIAMGNGMQELKDKADYVTAANTDDGILKACQHFGWITAEYRP